MAIVAIVGAGFMGTATAWPLTDNGHTVRLVGTHLDGEIVRSCKETRYHPKLKRDLPAGVQSYSVEEIAEALEGADIVVSGVSSLGVRWIGRTLGPHLKPTQVIIAITKGLETNSSGQPMILPDVLAGELPSDLRHRVKQAVVGGPCIAGELAGRRHSCVMFASRDRDTVQMLATAFQTSYYHVRTTTDVIGLEYCAALKNAYTLGVGIVGGVMERAGGVDSAGAQMHNLGAAFFAQACTEIARILQVVGGTPQFAYGLPGAGDLYVTCQGGRTVRLGRLLGMGHTYSEACEIMAGETLESVEIVRQMGRALPGLVARGRLGAEELPLLRGLVEVVCQGRPIEVLLDTFLQGWGIAVDGAASGNLGSRSVE